VEANTSHVLGLFAAADVRATFFVLGWVAERHSDLLKRIAGAGHEIASHSYGHRLVYDMTPDEFRHDLGRAKGVIEAATGQPVVGFRAPSFSITARSTWALDVLFQEGYEYDASIFPIHHDRYGIPSAPRHAYAVRGGRAAASDSPSGRAPTVRSAEPEARRQMGRHEADRVLWEVPPSTVRFAGTNFPLGGGGYLRILPYAWTRFGLKRLNEREGQPGMVYLHPWEVDPSQPRLDAPLVSRFRHYRNLRDMEPRLRRLLSEFKFAPIREVIAALTESRPPGVASDGAAPPAPQARLT
jgi:polysaccharide deacetylase family protein (PEP-CTERM system associated)